MFGTARMRADRAASVFLVDAMMQSGVLRTKAAISILMYHSISDTDEAGVSPYYRVATSPGRFREHMRWLKEAGYAVIDLAEALRRLTDPAAGLERSVVLTFDDGFRDFMSAAWPVLSEFSFNATVFLPTGFIGDHRQSFQGRPCLTWAEVRELGRHGVSFGSHTVTHPTLYRLEWTEVRRELRDSRAQIEQELEAPASTFAYPYAFPQEDRDYVGRLRDELLLSGYTGGVTTVIGRARPEHDRLCLRRLPVNEEDDHPLFMSKLRGAYDWVGGLQAAFRHTKRRCAAFASAWRVA
jgi:peptidoglycan/xylan/chitin deacetylase (PgdA/CDA1 family)